ncbi:MAG: tRNA glutamyl-Q(34) synthetase GluQRS [Synechococcus sp.]
MSLSAAFDHLPGHLQEPFLAGAVLRQSGYRGRFAPTPSGPLHLGNLRTALVSWLAARAAGGTWLLRFDDLDTPRVRSGAIDSALGDLRWLGLDWDGPVILQSQRLGLYNSVLSHLRRRGQLYACRCSRRDLAQTVVYPGTCRPRQLHWGWQAARLPSWRLRLDEAWGCGDVVVRRADGFIAYHLATAVDELTCGINAVVRGVDLRPARAAQVAVMAALGQPPPQYRHVPLLCDASGQKLAKREGSAGLAPWRERQMRPEAVVGHLAAQLKLVPDSSKISAAELLQELKASGSNAVNLLQA